MATRVAADKVCPAGMRGWRRWLAAWALVVLVVVSGLVIEERTPFFGPSPSDYVEDVIPRKLHGSLWEAPSTDAIHSPVYTTVGELVGSSLACQTFVAAYNRLTAVDVMMFNYNRENSGPVLFHLRSAPDDAIDLFTLSVDASAVENTPYTRFAFPTLPDSAGQSLAFCLEAPGAELLNSVTVWGVTIDRYPDGRALLPGMWGQAAGVRDLSFRLGYDLPLWQKLALWAERLPQSKPFLCGHLGAYILLGMAYLVLIYVFFSASLRRFMGNEG